MAKTQTESALTLLEMAASEVESLQGEMTDWQGNMEGANMDHLPKYEQVTECVDALENADVRSRVDELATLVEMAGSLGDLGAVMATYVQSTAKRKTRADRLGEAQGWLEQALAALDDRLQDLKDQDDLRVKADEEANPETEAEPDPRIEEVQAALSDLRDAMDSLSDVSFPGMYG